MFNFAQMMGFARLALGMFGGGELTAHGINAASVSDVLAHVTTPGGLVLGLAPVIASGLWTYYAHTVEATVNRAVQMAPGNVKVTPN